jgi:hypothetical protein
MNINWLGALFILFSQFCGKGKEKQNPEFRSQESEEKKIKRRTASALLFWILAPEFCFSL